MAKIYGPALRSLAKIFRIEGQGQAPQLLEQPSLPVQYVMDVGRIASAESAIPWAFPFSLSTAGAGIETLRAKLTPEQMMFWAADANARALPELTLQDVDIWLTELFYVSNQAASFEFAAVGHVDQYTGRTAYLSHLADPVGAGIIAGKTQALRPAAANVGLLALQELPYRLWSGHVVTSSLADAGTLGVIAVTEAGSSAGDAIIVTARGVILPTGVNLWLS